MTLLFSVRRDGRSLTDMAREEVGPVGGVVAFLAVVTILVILLGAVALIVVNALKGSPWGTFTIAMTIPIALLMGVYLRRWRPGKVLESSILGFVLVMLAIFGGQWISGSSLAHYFTFSAIDPGGGDYHYGFCASAMPVWLLLAPRDYLSTFVKLGTIAVLAIGIVGLRPTLHMPGLHAVYRRHRAAVCGQPVSFRVHHHRLRRHQRLSLVDCHWNNAEADSAGIGDAPGGLRGHARSSRWLPSWR